MSKKSRRARAKGRSFEPAAPAAAARPQPKMQAAPAVKQAAAPATMAFQPKNYEYVTSDMVRIAIIAGSLLVILIILTFIPALQS